MKTQAMIDDLERGINERISGMNVTEGARQRQLAVEQKPLAQQLQTLGRTAGYQQAGLQSGQANLAQMLGLAQSDQERQAQIAKAPMEFSQSLLPLLQNMATYQSPESEVNNALALFAGQQQIKQQYTTPTAPETITTSNGIYAFNPQTGKFDQFVGKAPLPSSSTNAPTSYDEWSLAGGQEGTGKSYAQWLQESIVKPATAAQGITAGYASRIEQAEPTLKSTQDKIVNMNPLQFSLTWDKPSWMQSTELQQYMQAARNFVNAVLRRESGAVISPSEFDEARKQYLPQPGDSAETLQLKDKNRQVILQSLIKASGSAYTPLSELLGETSTQGTSTLSGGGLNLNQFEIGGTTAGSTTSVVR